MEVRKESDKMKQIKEVIGFWEEAIIEPTFAQKQIALDRGEDIEFRADQEGVEKKINFIYRKRNVQGRICV